MGDSFIHSLGFSLVGACSVLGTGPGVGNTAVNKDKKLFPIELTACGGDRLN